MGWADYSTNHGDLIADLVPALQLPEEEFRFGIRLAADMAVQFGRSAVFVGAIRGGHGMICVNGCCVGRRGAVIVVPDVERIEAEANGYREVATTWRMQRDDGREVYLYRAPKGGASS